MRKPWIGITMGRRAVGPTPPPSPRLRPARPEVWLGEALVRAVRDAGGVPVLFPPDDGEISAHDLLSRVDGVVLAGGAFDIHPRHYGQAITGRLDPVDEGRTGVELGLARACLDGFVPVFGICGGMQALAVAAGGTLVQHIPDRFPQGLAHEQIEDPATPSHPVHFADGHLAAILGQVSHVNSTHHQAVDKLGCFIATGVAPDGVIEAIEGPEPWCVGVQWHPELLGEPHAALFRAFVAAAQTGRS